MKKILIAVIFLVSFTFVTPILAQEKCTVNGNVVPCEQVFQSAGSLIVVFFAIMIAFFVLSILATIFWLMMIIHAANNNIENKTVWIVVLVLTGPIGAIVYYFVVKRVFINSSTPPATIIEAPKNESNDIIK